MRMNQTTDHAIRIILLLATKKSIVSSNEMAEQTEVSRRYLFKVISKLRDAGIISVIRGSEGGYWLSKPPESISLYDIILLMEGPLQLPDHVYSTAQDNALGSAYIFFKDLYVDYTRMLTIDKLIYCTKSDILHLMYEMVLRKKTDLFS